MKLENFCEKNHFKEDLSLSFCDYFLLNAFRYLVFKNASRRGILSVSTEDNNGIQQFYKNKNFLHKSFKIKINKRKHVIQIGVEKNGVFKSLHDNEHINSLIWGIDPSQDYTDGIKFNEKMDSIHFVYAGSDASESNETVILSVQTFEE